MTIISRDQLTRDMQSSAHQLIDRIGIVPLAEDRPIDADDLLYYISETSMPMARFMHEHGLFMDSDGLHVDLAQFSAIKELAEKVIPNTRPVIWMECGESSTSPEMTTPTTTAVIF
jgi:hypothetical protein